MPVFFNGRLLVTPTVASRVDDTKMANMNLTVPMNLAIIGKAEAGEPKKVYTFQNPVEARRILQGGELLTAVEKAFSPSAMTGAPMTIRAIRVDPAIPARHCVPRKGTTVVSGALQAYSGTDAAYRVKLAAAASAVNGFYRNWMITMTSGDAQGETNLIDGYTGSTKEASLVYPWSKNPAATDTYELRKCSFALESTDFGDNANLIKARLQAGTDPGTYKASTAFEQESCVQDNLEAVYLNVAYTGTAAVKTLHVSDARLRVRVGASEDAMTDLVVADLSDYDTVQELADYLDTVTGLSATIVSGCEELPVYKMLTPVEGLEIDSEGVDVTAKVSAIVAWFNGFGEPFIKARRVTGYAPKTFDWAFLRGGKTLAATPTDWQECFDLLQNEDVQIVVALSSSSAIHRMLSDHCDFMSNQGQMERRGITGGALGEDIDAHIARAAVMNSDRLYMCAPGVMDYDRTGALVTYPPYVFAAMVGGMACGVDPGTPLTFKTLKIAGLEQEFRNPADTDKLINGGVLAVMKTKQGYRVVKSISTWLVNENFNRVELSTGIAVDFVARNVRENLLEMLGKKARPAALNEALSRVESTLKELARPEPMGPEVIVGDEKNPPYKNITASIEGDVLRVYFECSPVVPINYVPVGIAVQVWSGSASAAVQEAPGA